MRSRLWSSKSEAAGGLEAFVSSKDTCGALPMGYGKSIIYPLLPSIFDIIRDKQWKMKNVCSSY